MTYFLVVVNGVLPFLCALLGALGSSGGSSSRYLRNRCSSASRWRAAATACAWLAVVDDGPFVDTPEKKSILMNKFSFDFWFTTKLVNVNSNNIVIIERKCCNLRDIGYSTSSLSRLQVKSLALQTGVDM